MAVGLKVTGLDELSDQLGRVGTDAPKVAAYALYEGAAVIADAYDAAIGSIQTAPFKYAKPGEKRLPSPEEVAAINGKVGIAKFRGDGTEVQTLVGVQEAGYAEVNWNHMRSTGRTNYKLKGNKAVWSGKAYLRMGSDGHAVKDRSGGRLQSAKPVGVIANSINSGTSFMQKQPVFRKAVRGAQAKALAAMDKKAQEMIDEIAGGN